MTEYSADILFDRFLDYIELYFKSRDNLIRQINSVKLGDRELDEEELDFRFGDSQQEVNQYRDLARVALDSYLRATVPGLDASPNT